MNSNWSYGPETAKLGVDLCDLDLWPLTLTFCMAVTFVMGNTVGSLNADILRYNADNLSITLKLWGKLDENVSWVNTFSSHSSISLHFTRQNIAYRVATVSTLATASMLSTHIVLSRGNGCHKRATTLILWGRRQFWGNFRFQPG